MAGKQVCMKFPVTVALAAMMVSLSGCVLDSSVDDLFGEAGAGGTGGQGGTGGSGGSTSSSGGQGGTGGQGGSGGSTSSTGGQGGTGGMGGTGGTGGTGGSGGGCSQSGTVVFDSAMSCYKHGLYRNGDFLPEPDSSSDTAMCENGSCANTPQVGDLEVLWVQEGQSDGLFTSVSQPASYAARCTTYTAAGPPTLAQMKAELGLPTGWFIPGVSQVGDSYTLIAVSCGAGQSALYEVIY